jgi:hypothetical protein
MKKEDLRKLVEKYYDETPEDIVGVSYRKKMRDGKFTDEDAIVFTVKKKKPIEEIPEGELLPEVINFNGTELKTDVIEGSYQLLQCQQWVIPPPNRNKFRPLKGGVSVTNYTNKSNSIGTLGFIAVDTESNSLVAVSNNHVLVKNAFLAPYVATSLPPLTDSYQNMVTQPNDGVDAGLQSSIGIVKKYVPLIKSPFGNTADVALTTVNESDIDTSVSYLQEGLNGWSGPLEFATTEEIDSLSAGTIDLYSAGRTTGPKGEGSTKLRAFSTISTINVPYFNQIEDRNYWEVVKFNNSIGFLATATTLNPGQICTYPVAGGDSGSALLADFNGTRKIVGLVFAGEPISTTDLRIKYGYANRIDDVAEQIGISAWTGNTVSYSDTGNTEQHIVSGLSTDTTLVLSGKTFNQLGTST